MTDSGTAGIWPATRLTQVFGIRYPIAAAGMGFVGMTPDLAIAVSQAGGIGALGVGKLPAPLVRVMIEKIKAATAAPFNINFLTPFTEAAHIDVCVEMCVPIVSFHWGHPNRRIIDRLHRAGIKVWEQVGTVDAGKRAVDDGIDGVVAQGTEAGGHNFATLPTLALVPMMADAVQPPLLLAAGGIADGRGLAAVLALGADGAWVGSRLVASAEAYAHIDYKRRLVDAVGNDTILTSLFGPEEESFNPMRVLKSAVIREWHGREREIPSNPLDRPSIGTTDLFGQSVDLPKFTNFIPIPTTEGNLDEMPLLAGEGIGLIHDVKPAAVILNRMAEDAGRILSNLGKACTHA